MLPIVILLSIIIIILLVRVQNLNSYNIHNNQKDLSKNKTPNKSSDIIFTINGKEIDFNTPIESLSERRKRTYARDKRLTRHRRVWSILRYMVTYQELLSADNFYGIRNAIISHKEAKGRMRKEHIEEYDIEIAIRFCRMENYYDICHHKLSISDIDNLRDWRNFQLNEEALYSNVMSNYETYWRRTLDSYKRIHAKKHRLEELIYDIDEIVELQELQIYPDIINKLKILKESYTKELNETITIMDSKKSR